MLIAYFDKSGDDNDPSQSYLTLSGIAATNEQWTEIDQNWRYILQCGPFKASYMHMVEAVHLRKEFSRSEGWTDDAVSPIINSLVSYITTLSEDSYCQFACTVDVDAYRRLSAESYQMDSPVDICNTWCVEQVMDWYTKEYKGGLDFAASYYFDEGEPFEPIFRAKWEREVKREQQLGYNGVWSHIRHVGSRTMKTTPGVQLADMLAWGRNREETK